jgi:hypothetical protein
VKAKRHARRIPETRLGNWQQTTTGNPAPRQPCLVHRQPSTVNQHRAFATSNP